MMKLWKCATTSLVALGFAAVPALAQLGQIDNQNYGTQVNITVAEEVSIWAAASVDLTLDGKNAENSDAVASTVSHINNVAADISVKAEELTAGSGTTLENVNFFIFDGGTATDAINAIAANANAPAGAFKWTDATLGTSYAFASVGVSSNVTNRPVVYAASAPNVLPDPDAYSLVVTWTIAPTP